MADNLCDMRNFFHKISIIFLAFVSAEYFFLSILSFLLLPPAPIIAEFGLVTPLAIVHPASRTLTGCLPPGSCDVVSDTEKRYAEKITYILALIALIGSVVSFLGALDMWRGRSIGYSIWKFFLLLSFVVVLWNWYWVFNESFSSQWRPGNWIIGVFSTAWTVLYTLAYIVAKKTRVVSETSRLP